MRFLTPHSLTAASSLLGAAGMALLLALPACSHDSYLVVTLTSADTNFTDVSWVDVQVEGAGVTSPTLSYGAREPLSFSSTVGVTLSISFTPSRSGTVKLTVTARGADRACIGSGVQEGVAIKKGDVAAVAVQLRHGCPLGDDGGVIFSGCNPADPSATCKSNQTCFVDCGSRMGMCIAGGNKGPGETCTSNNDCMPGTQCFDYSTIPGCAPGTRVCLKFCANDGMCPGGEAAADGGVKDSAGAGTGGASPTAADAGAGGTTGQGGATSGAAGAAPSSAGGAAGTAGTGLATFASSALLVAASNDLPPAACRNPVACREPAVVTAYRTCSFRCDPRGDAQAGCPTGLLCFLYRDPVTEKDNPDCGCREPARLKTDGMACAAADECAPGHVCNMMNGTQICRRLCQTTSAGDCPSPRTCQPLTGTAFGVCL